MENKFSASESKYGLWKALGAKVNGAPTDGVDETVMQMFILNQDSDKARETAALVLGIAAQIAPTAKFVIEAGKSNGLVARLTVTGAQVIAKANAIVQLGKTNVAYEIVHAGVAGSKSAKAPKGNKLAGLITASPVIAAPAKK